MSSFIIEGGHPLKGTITPQGAKNEALEVISATLLTAEEVCIKNIPDILDVKNLIQLLKDIGVKVSRITPSDYIFKADDVNLEYLQSDDFIQKCSHLRGSVLLIGPLLARFGKAVVAKPGGDKIGRRRLDTHFLGFKYLGAKFSHITERNVYEINGKHLKGCPSNAINGGKIAQCEIFRCNEQRDSFSVGILNEENNPQDYQFSFSDLQQAKANAASVTAAKGVNDLLLGVAIAMIASVCGIILTTLNSLLFKKYKQEEEEGKNSFLAWMQSKLLPELPSDTGDVMKRLVRGLNQFNNEFTKNSSTLSNTFNRVNESYRIQADVIQAVQDMDITSMAKANVKVWKQLQESTDKIEQFNEYLSKLDEF